MRIAKKVLKWLGIVLGGLLGVIVVAAVVLYFIAGSRLNETYDIDVAAVPVPTDDAAIQRGKHIAESYALCIGCHGDNLQGDILEDIPLVGTFAPTNLTKGLGGIGGGYVNRCVTDIRRRPSQPLSQRRSHPRIERRDRRLRSTQEPSDA